MAKPSKLPEWDTTQVNSIEPDQAHKDEGWLAPGGVPEKPPFQTFNYWQNEVYRWLSEINIAGILTYDALTNYIATVSYVIGSDGNLYACWVNNGPASSVVNPVGDITGVWSIFETNIYRIDASEADQGITGNGKTIKSYVDAIGTSKKATLILTHNGIGNTTTYTVTTDETIPSNITLEIENGAILDGAGMLTINGPFKSDLSQVFGSGITVAGLSEIYPQWFGAIGDGETDDTVAIRKCFAAWASSSGTTGKCKMIVPAGNYKITSTIDLRTMFAAAVYYGLSLEMDAGAIFTAATFLNPIIDFSPTDGGSFAFCDFKFGSFNGNLTGSTLLLVRNIVDSNIYIQGIGASVDEDTGVGVLFKSSNISAVLNNFITIVNLNNNYVGILAQDNSVLGQGFQGNNVQIAHCTTNSIGVWLQDQSSSNTFKINSLEANTGSGVLDQAGYNIYQINFADETAGNELVMTTANGRIDVEGYGVEITNDGGGNGYFKDNKASVIPATPLVPDSNVAYVNTFKRPALVTITGGTDLSVYLNDVAAPNNGSFKVPFGGCVTLIYTGAPTWLWTFD